MKRQPFRFWMTGCAAVLVATMAGPDAPDDERSAQARDSRYGLRETVERLSASAQRHGLSVLAQVAAPRRIGGAGESLLIVFASAEGGTPVVMAERGAAPQAPLAVVVRADALGAAQVDLPSADWDGLPDGVVRELTALPQLVDDALKG
ncbi:hypothetical protein V4F39_14440 [Aquincola sp. MAHUQ-54]|uniref:DUF302 domain-containing protein n=1 Tax=Aquincola agrisoli TaxID=3119538 RepID=A0AAW9Q5M4_9BURK